jgi:2-hydroxychromene-2-carboxylate isomerase
MLSIIDAAKKLQAFEQGALTNRITVLEKEMSASNLASCISILNSLGIDDSLLTAALTMKRVSGQIKGTTRGQTTRGQVYKRHGVRSIMFDFPFFFFISQHPT